MSVPDSPLGILVVGFARPRLLEATLTSLGRQDALGQVHVWIDGTAGRMEMPRTPAESVEVARRFPVRTIRAHGGHLGIEKLMLDGLAELSRHHDRIIVLEDDCFPTRDAVALFEEQLAATAGRPEVFSVYGHPFLCPAEGDTITRFQGWGWAVHRQRLAPVLARARELFGLPEHEYLEFVRASLTPGVLARLDVTPGRNVHETALKFFSWDSCTALLTAMAGQVHARTRTRAVFNCGLGGDSGHFPEMEFLRRPPFNMIAPDEVWRHF